MKLVLNEIDFLRVLHISGHMYGLSRSTDFPSGLEERKTRENRPVFFLLPRQRLDVVKCVYSTHELITYDQTSL